MSFLFTATDVLLLLLLWKAFHSNTRAFYFNPYLSIPDGLLEKALDYAQPIVPGLRKRYLALVVFVFLLAFRNLLFPGLETMPIAEIGGGLTFPSLYGKVPRLFSVMFTGTMRFLQFLLSVWGTFLFVRIIEGKTSRTRIFDAYEDLAFPFSRLKIGQMIGLLVLLHGLLALMPMLIEGRNCLALGAPGEEPALFSLCDALGRRLLAALWLGMIATISTTLLFTQKLLIFFIFVSIFSLILVKRELAVFSQEAINLLLGRFADRPLHLGSFDFTPILFYMGLSISYHLLVTFGLLSLQPLFITHI